MLLGSMKLGHTMETLKVESGLKPSWEAFATGF